MPKKPSKPKKADKAEAEPATEPEPWTCPECDQAHEDDDAKETECIACGHARPAAAAPAEDEEGGRFCSINVGLVTAVEELAGKLTLCTIDVGTSDAVSIVTNATNVAEGSRVVVAAAGAQVTSGGEDITVAKRSVGGRASDGMLCDAPMLGWVGGGAGAAALVPESFAPGDKPPERRPRMDGK